MYFNKQFKFLINIISANINGNEDSFTYTSFKTNLLIEKFVENAVWEIKIRAGVDVEFGDWSEIKKFKLDELDDDKGNLLVGENIFNSDFQNEDFFNIVYNNFEKKNSELQSINANKKINELSPNLIVEEEANIKKDE